MGAQLSIAAGVLEQNSGFKVDVCYIDYDKYLPQFRKPEPESTRILLIKNPLAIPYKIFGKINTEKLDSEEIITRPHFKGRNFKIDEKLVFILMPFSEEWSDGMWNDVFQPLCNSIGLIVKRADELTGPDIMEDVWKEINIANIIIADITNRNPNVFYELGIAHTLGKKIILLTQNTKDIPFDLNRYRFICYENKISSYRNLETKLKDMIREIIK